MQRSVIFCLVLLVTAGLATTTARAAEPRPNIIVIYTDDHGWPDIGAAGIYDDLKTPHIDALAQSGVRALSGYSTAPQCVPSRAGLLSGRYQNRFGVESNGNDLAGFDAQLTIAERLKKAGYATGMAGKWHLGEVAEIPAHGFDHAFPMNSNRPPLTNITLEGKDRPMRPLDVEMYHIDACSLVASAFIERYKNQPFFFYLAYRAPHVPLDAPPEYLKRFPGKMPERRRQALAMISAIDDGVGLIQQTLRKHKMEERTLIFFIGDNGAPLKIHKLDEPGGGPGWDGSLNEPMNGEKGMLTEGGMRVPFLVSWPGTIPAGQVYRHPVIALDVAATAVALAGLPDDQALDGVNLIPFLSGKQDGAPHETLYWRWTSQAAVREGKWKYLRGGSREYLFDLEADPGEKHNLLAQHPDIVQSLSTKLDAWGAKLQPPGIEKQQLTPAADAYFDFYLDGKPVAEPRPNDDSKRTPRPRKPRNRRNKAAR